MAITIKPKRSSTASQTPTTSNLEVGEIAVNLADKKIFVRDTSDNIFDLTEVVTDASPQLGGNLDANTNSINNLPSIDFDTAAGATTAEAKLFWNETSGTLSIGMDHGSQEVGFHSYILGKATEAIAKGDVVMFAGVQGDHITIAKADVDAVGFVPEWVIGVAPEALSTNDFGHIVVLGEVTDIDTSTPLSEGDILWLDPSVDGGLTATEPTAPNPKILIAAVTKSDATEGIIKVRVERSQPLGRLQDVYVPSPSDGQVLTWDNGNSRWNAETITQASGNELENIVEDTTPQLGGDLDLNSNNITGTGNINTTGTITATGNLTVDTNTLFVDASNNRVGIGTSSPAYQVEIENTGANALLVLDRTDGASTFIEGGATDSVIGSVGANDVKIAYNSVPVVTIGSGGAITTSGNIRGGSLRADNFTTENAFAVVGSDNNLIQDTTLSVDPASNYLGINQTSPEVTLHMTGEGAQTAQIRMEQYNDSADAPDLRTRRYRGTIASPSAVQSGDYLYRSNHEYWNGTSLLIGGAFAFDNTNNANRTEYRIAVDTDGTGGDVLNGWQFKIDGNDSGAITFNNAYKFPTTDGSADQILQTNGSGVLTFVDVPMGTLPLGDSSSNAGSVPSGDALEFRSGNSITATVSGNGVTYALNDSISVNQISSDDSTNIRVADNLVPAADNTYSLGTPDRKWSALYVEGSTIFLDTTKLQVDGSGDFTVKDAGNNLKRVVASEIEIGHGSNKIKMQRGANGRVKFLDENDTPTPVLQIVGDDSTGVSLNSNETVKIAGTQNITTAVSGDTLTITGPDLSAFITAASTDTLTNKTFDANGTGNSISNIEVGDFASGEILDEDNMSSNSATKLATQQSIKAYVDSVAGGTLSLGDSASNSGSVDVNGGDNLEFRSGDSITATVAGNGVTVGLNDDITVNQIGAKDSTDISVTSPVQLSSTLQVAGATTHNGDVTVADGKYLYLGNGQDLRIYHTGTNSHIEDHGTGDLYLKASNNAFFQGKNTNHVIQQWGDFGGNGFTKLRYGNVEVFETVSGGVKVSGDAEVTGNLTVSGTTTYVDTTNLTVSDPLIILSKGNSGGSDVDAGFMVERGSAGNNAVFYWNEGDDKFKAVTSTSGHDATAITDSATATIVADLEGDVTASSITVNEIAAADSSSISIQSPLQLDSTLQVAGNSTMNGNVNLSDNNKLQLGASQDLQLYHDGSNSFVDDTGTGNLYIRSNAIRIQKYTNENMITADADLGVGLYYDNALTFQTISGGAEVTGDLKVDSISANDSSVVSINSPIHVDTISSSNSTAIQINDGVNISGTLSVNSIDVNSLTSSDSTGINIDEAKLYVNGASVLTAGSGGDVEQTTSTAQVSDVLINNSGTVFRIPLANIDISSFNNDAGFASGGVSGFSASTVTSFPVELGDSAARDYGDGEPNGVGTGTAENTDAFGVALGTTFDAMEPNGSVQTTDLGSEEAHVGA